MPADRPLTGKQERLCEEYLVDSNATQAAIRAGYSARTAKAIAHEMMGKAHIQARMAELRAAQSERTQTGADWVVENAKEVVERCFQRAPVMVRRGKEMVQLEDEEGRDVWQFDAQGVLGGLTLISKIQGLLNRAKVHVNADLDKLTDAQLQHLANGGDLADLPR